MNNAIILAAGSSVRMGGESKVFIDILGHPAIYWTILVFERHRQISEIILVVKKEDKQRISELIRQETFKKIKTVVEGGRERQESVLNGLEEGQKLGWQKNDLVCIQDGARILVTDKEITSGILAAESSGAALVGVAAKDTIHVLDKNGNLDQTPNRKLLLAAQTPQILRFGLALDAFLKAKKEKKFFTDDVSLARYYNPKLQVKTAQGSYENLKITTPEDIVMAENILRARQKYCA